MVKYQSYKPTKLEVRLDNLFRTFAPKRARDRAVAREQLNYFRYLAAEPTGSRRNATPVTSGEWLRGSREKLQVMWNAINMVENNGLCSGILQKFEIYTCGTIRFQARTGDKGVNAQYEQYMREKCGKPSNIDLSERFTLRQLLMLDIKGIVLKGDIGCNIVRENGELYLQTIEADRIGDPYTYVISNRYVRGLILDDVGRLVSVNVYRRDRQNGYYRFDRNLKFRDEYGMPSFLFMVNPISYDDYRGVSVFKSAIDNATYIERMREFELQALLWAASQSGVFKTTSGLLPPKLPFDKLNPLIDGGGNQIDTYQVRPNTITAIGTEEDVTMFQHDRPSPNVVAMYRDTIRDIAVGTGLSYGFVFDMSALTGPAVRMTSAQDARAIEMWQLLLREQKLDPITMLILGNAIANGELPYHERWTEWQWFFPPKPTIDVGRESQANVQEVEAGLNSATNVMEGEYGEDAHEIREQRGIEVEHYIEIAKEIADQYGAEWEQVYALLLPPPRGSLGPAGQSIAGKEDGELGATSGGASFSREQEYSRNGH